MLDAYTRIELLKIAIAPAFGGADPVETAERLETYINRGLTHPTVNSCEDKPTPDAEPVPSHDEMVMAHLQDLLDGVFGPGVMRVAGIVEQ